MRCPKCHYLSFEPEPRCKNCGFDLEVPAADLALRTDSDRAGALDDLSLRPLAATPAAPITVEMDPIGRRPGPSDERESAIREAEAPPALPVTPPSLPVTPPPVVASPRSQAPAPPSRPARPVPRAPHTTTELPLFVKAGASSDAAAVVESPAWLAEATEPDRLDDSDVPSAMLRAAGDQESDEPLVTVPSSPRAPLGVRRGTLSHEAARTRSRPPSGGRRLGPFDRDLLEDLQRVEREEAQPARGQGDPSERLAGTTPATDVVSPRTRLTAAAIDLGFTGMIGVAVVWATLRLCNVALAEVGWAALAPLVVFLLLVNVGYLVLFTAAGGQTLGKMALGIRVVGTSSEDVRDETLTPGQAAWRALLTVPSVFVLGAGLWPALVGGGLALHDRIAGTRVVRA